MYEFSIHPVTQQDVIHVFGDESSMNKGHAQSLRMNGLTYEALVRSKAARASKTYDSSMVI